MTAEKPLAERPEFSPLSLARMLWKHKLLIGVLWVALSLVSSAVVYFLPTIYKSETLILVDSQKIPERYVSSTVGGEVQDRLATIKQQILSATRLQKIIDDFGLYREERKSYVQEEIIEKMRKDIETTLERGWTRERPGAFRIAYQGRDPRVVAEVANRLANLYIEENLKAREVQAEGTSEFIVNQLQQAKKTLDDLEARVSQYKLQHNGELPQQEPSLNGTLARLQVELQGVQDATNRAQQNKLMLENAIHVAETSQATRTRAIEQASSTAPAAVGTPNSPAAPPRKKSDAMQAEMDAVRLRYSEDHPDTKRLQGEIARVRELEKAEAEKEEPPKAGAAGTTTAAAKQVSVAVRPEAQTLLRDRERVDSLKSQLALNERELQVRSDDRQRTLRSIGLYQSRLERLPVREQEMAAVTRDYEMAKLNYRSLLDKKLSSEMATDMERRQKAERFTVLDPARVPEIPFKPNRPALLALGYALSLGLAIAIGIGKELKKDALLGDWELPPGLLILGRVPRIEIPLPQVQKL